MKRLVKLTLITADGRQNAVAVNTDTIEYIVPGLVSTVIYFNSNRHLNVGEGIDEIIKKQNEKDEQIFVTLVIFV